MCFISLRSLPSLCSDSEASPPTLPLCVGAKVRPKVPSPKTQEILLIEPLVLWSDSPDSPRQKQWSESILVFYSCWNK